jgi:hypothetical protein
MGPGNFSSTTLFAYMAGLRTFLGSKYIALVIDSVFNSADSAIDFGLGGYFGLRLLDKKDNTGNLENWGFYLVGYPSNGSVNLIIGVTYLF